MHLCLLTNDLNGVVEHLKQDGVVIEQELRVGLDYNSQAWVRDPDGNSIELMQPDEKSPQRAKARAVAGQI